MPKIIPAKVCGGSEEDFAGLLGREGQTALGQRINVYEEVTTIEMIGEECETRWMKRDSVRRT